MDFTRYDEIMQAINEKVAAFMDAEQLPEWNHCITRGANTPAELNCSDSKIVSAPYTWSSADGDAWFLKDVTLPEEVNGIKLAGSAVDFMFILPIGATVFLDGEQIYHEPFWADTRAVELQLFSDLDPSRKFSIAVKARSGDGFGLFLQLFLRVQSLDNAIYELETIREQMRFCRLLFEKKANSGADALAYEQALTSAVDGIDLDALRSNNWQGLKATTAAAVEKLMIFNEEAKQYEASLIAHSHIDMNWLWPWEETVELCRRDFTSMDSLMTRFPDFYFSQSQVAVYKAMKDYHPEVFEMMKARIKEGRWDVPAATWVEGDLNTAMGETLVRQILHSKRFLKEHFDIEPRICWEPDTFGHPATLPQILKKSGVDYYYFCRAGKGHPVFWWEAPDGSRVQAFNDAFGYGGNVSPTVLVECCKLVMDKLDLKTGLWVYGVGDHGGAATAIDVERGIAANEIPLLPNATMRGITDYHKMLETTGVDYPVVCDELNTIFEGCYSSHGDIKWLNRYGETSLLTAETMAAMAALDTGREYPTETLADGWKEQSFHQFHDILCGCSIGSTYVDAAKSLVPVHCSLSEITADSAAKLAAKVDTGEGGEKVVVFNQLAWERTELVEVPVNKLGLTDVSGMVARDESGIEVPVQILDGKLIFIAKDVPSLGCKVYAIAQGAVQTKLKADETAKSMENEFFSVKINPASGAIDSLIIKSINREIAAPAAGWGPEGKSIAGTLNRFVIYFEQPHTMSAWNIGDITGTKSLISGAEVRVVECGPVCAAVEVKHSFLSSSLTQQIRVYAGLDRIDFVTDVDWHEKGTAETDAPMLKATFSPLFGASKATYEIPFGAIERFAGGGEVPALRWADISEEQCGISLLNNCKYGHSAQGNTLALTLVRASYEPDNNPDERVNNFTYSLCPHAGSVDNAEATRRGSELNQPIIAAVEGAHAGSIRPGEAYLTCESDNIIVSAVKLAEDQPHDSTAMVIRLFESKGEPVSGKLQVKWPVLRAEETDMLERTEKKLTVTNNTLALNFGKHEIKTIKLYIKK